MIKEALQNHSKIRLPLSLWSHVSLLGISSRDYGNGMGRFRTKAACRETVPILSSPISSAHFKSGYRTHILGCLDIIVSICLVIWLVARIRRQLQFCDVFQRANVPGDFRHVGFVQECQQQCFFVVEPIRCGGWEGVSITSQNTSVPRYLIASSVGTTPHYSRVRASLVPGSWVQGYLFVFSYWKGSGKNLVLKVSFASQTLSIPHAALITSSTPEVVSTQFMRRGVHEYVRYERDGRTNRHTSLGHRPPLVASVPPHWEHSVSI